LNAEVGKKRSGNVACDELPSTCSGPELVEGSRVEVGKKVLKAIFDGCLKSIIPAKKKPAYVPPVFFIAPDTIIF
jgi:hypothetical protein